jgi:thioredoxin-related protein
MSFAPRQAAAPGDKVRWMHWDEAVSHIEQQDKNVLLHIYTDWCTWCKRMDTITFNAAPNSSYLNDKFYTVRLNAERKTSIDYKDKSYTCVEDGKRGYHQFAAELLRGRMSFPSVVFMDEQGEVIQSIVGYKSPEEFERILTYFAEDYYKETPWSAFKRNYAPKLIKKED